MALGGRGCVMGMSAEIEAMNQKESRMLIKHTAFLQANFGALAIEEDGDEVFTRTPKTCLQWKCRNKPNKLENRKGFMVCPNCGGSYGASVKIKESHANKIRTS